MSINESDTESITDAEMDLRISLAKIHILSPECLIKNRYVILNSKTVNTKIKIYGQIVEWDTYQLKVAYKQMIINGILSNGLQEEIVALKDDDLINKKYKIYINDRRIIVTIDKLIRDAIATLLLDSKMKSNIEGRILQTKDDSIIKRWLGKWAKKRQALIYENILQKGVIRTPAGLLDLEDTTEDHKINSYIQQLIIKRYTSLKYDFAPVGAGIILTALNAKTNSRLGEIARREIENGVSVYYSQDKLEKIREFLVIYCVEKSINLNSKIYNKIEYVQNVKKSFSELYERIKYILRTCNLFEVIKLPNTNDAWIKVCKEKSLNKMHK